MRRRHRLRRRLPATAAARAVQDGRRRRFIRRRLPHHPRQRAARAQPALPHQRVRHTPPLRGTHRAADRQAGHLGVGVDEYGDGVRGWASPPLGGAGGPDGPGEPGTVHGGALSPAPRHVEPPPVRGRDEQLCHRRRRAQRAAAPADARARRHRSGAEHRGVGCRRPPAHPAAFRAGGQQRPRR